jgi:two-component system, LuxR family, sensor histidine kinase DctS
MSQSLRPNLENDLQIYQAVLRSARFSIILADKQGLITAFNDEAERILGYKASEIIGKQTPGLFHDPQEVEETAQHLTEELGFEVPVGFETFIIKARFGNFDERQWTYISKTGHRTQVLLSVTALLNAKGEIYGYMGIAKDLTEALTAKSLIAEQQVKLVQSSKMAALGEMAAGIAHEINNPLTIISGRAELILNKISQGKRVTKEELTLGLSKIEENVSRVAKIVSSLKSLSRNSANDPQLSHNLQTLVLEAIDLCCEKFNHHRIGFQLELDNTHILCRAPEISQILTNLLNNSFDALIEQKFRLIKIKTFCGEHQSGLEFSDSGPGIPVAHRDKIMQPFFTTKEVGKGTGIGLSLSKQLAESNRGTLTLNDKHPNTQFVLSFPTPK